MSLFPSAGYVASAPDTKGKTEPEDSQSWLQNKSYHAKKASKLAEYEQKFDSDSSSSSENDIPLKKHKETSTSKSKEKIAAHKPTTSKKLPIDPVSMSKMGYIVDEIGSEKFKVDSLGDKDNVHFSRPYKVLIPKFYRHCLFCVGTPSWKHIEMSLTRKKKKRKRHRQEAKEERYFTREIPTARKFLPSKFSPLYDHFFSLGKETNEENDAVYETTKGINTTKKITEKFNRDTRENPNDVNLWKRFVSWQDEVMKKGGERVKARVTMEKKIEILNYAIRSNPKDESLQLMRVKLQSELQSDQSIIDKEWKNILFRFPDNLEVWKSYILHINCNSFSSFSIKRTKRAYEHCMEILRSIKDGTYMQETSSEISGEQRLVQLLSEYAHFLAATGHTEQWVAIYQCMLELNFRGPSSDTNWSDLVDYLKLYYVSDNKKIGEDGSKGFAEFAGKHVVGGWVSSNDDNSHDEPDEDEDDVDPEKTLTENWINIDQSRSEKHWLPWKPTFDGDECDDDERKVAFSDIKGFLFKVENERVKIQILNDFLNLLGSPISISTSASVPFSTQSIFHFRHSNQALRPYEQIYIARPLILGKNQSLQLGCLENTRHIYIRKVFQQLFLATKEQDSIHSLLCNCYALYFEKRCTSFYTDDRPRDLKTCGKEAKKEMKRMLASNSSLIEAWCSFAVIEWLCGKRQDALKIVEATLSMSSSNPKDPVKRRETAHKLYVLCRTFSQLHLTTCSHCDVTNSSKIHDCPLLKVLLSILICLGDGCSFERISDSSHLKSAYISKAVSGYSLLLEELQSLYEQFDYEKDFSTMTENEFSSPYFNVICCVFVFSVHLLPENTHKIANDAIEFFDSKIKKECLQAKIDLENFYELYFWYMRESNNFVRSDFRHLVYDAAQKFPCNPHFAWFLGEFDIASYLSGNVRRHFTKACTDNPTSIIPWLCAIEYELKRRRRILDNVYDVGMTPFSTNTLLDVRIKNLFEHGLAMDSNPGSAVLWRAYIHAQSQIDPSKIEGLYTRALDSCSWSRDLHIDILTYDPDKLTEVVANMSRKNLRLRTPVEEVQLLMTF